VLVVGGVDTCAVCEEEEEAGGSGWVVGGFRDVDLDVGWGVVDGDGPG